MSCKILAFDTTNGGLSVAISFDNKIISSANINEVGMQAEMLIPTIEACLNSAKIWYQDLNCIAVTAGPGSFTGVRIGMSAAKAISLASNLPLIGIGSLEAIAYSYRNSNDSKILVAIDAKMDELFIQEFQLLNGKLIANYEAKLIPAKDVENYYPKEKFLLVGTNRGDIITAENIALIAFEIYNQNYSQGQNFSADTIYIREPRISKRSGSKK